MKVLTVSSEKTLHDALRRDLSRRSFVVDVATNGEEAWELLQVFLYDVVLLEAELPKLDGLSLCSRLRNVGNPVLVLLIVEPSRSDAFIQGLDSGADACLTKPIHMPELLAHLRALERRRVHRASPLLSWGCLVLNPTAQRITCHGQVLELNRKEYQLLELFLSQPQRMFSQSEIGERLWPLNEESPTTATIKSHIRRIRHKLEQAGAQDLIQTRYGQGYYLNPAEDPNAKPSKQESSVADRDSITATLWQELMTANARLQQEIEHRSRIETQLRRSEMMLRNAQRVAQIGCWEFDVKTRETYWTEELFLIHGLDPTQPAPTAEEVFALIHPDDLQLHQEAIRAPALRGEAFEANIRIIRANDGEVRYINARGGPLFDHAGQLVKLTGTTFDLTQWLQS
jgi:DNA-binding response OmpR family regulator